MDLPITTPVAISQSTFLHRVLGFGKLPSYRTIYNYFVFSNKIVECRYESLIKTDVFLAALVLFAVNLNLPVSNSCCRGYVGFFCAFLTHLHPIFLI